MVEQALINMNGRIYDYNLGRFMSVDPFIQAPQSSQSINPYSYIMNNPMSGTDPTGYKSSNANAGNWHDTCFEPDGCLMTPTEKALAKYVGNGEKNNGMSKATNDALDKLHGDMAKFHAWQDDFWSAMGNVEIIDLPSDGTSVDKPNNIGSAAGVGALTPKTVGSAPATVDLSALDPQFSALWGKSFPNGNSQEQGGTIVDTTTGKEYLINEGSGTSGSFSPDLSVPSSRFNVIGVYHTHPYDTSEGGHTEVSLSGGDAAYLINQGHRLIIAQSGKQQFMFMRTRTTTASVNFNSLNNSANARIASLVVSGKKFNVASQQAAKETASAHGLAYYEGVKGVFKKIN